MTWSVASPVKDALEAYVAGRVKADRVVAAVVTAYYAKRESGNGTALRALVDVIERAAPGVVELSGSANRPGYGVRLAERPFPREYEPQLRVAVAAYLRRDTAAGEGGGWSSVAQSRPGVVERLLGIVRKLVGRCD